MLESQAQNEFVPLLSALPFEKILSKGTRGRLSSDWACAGINIPLGAFINSAALAVFAILFFLLALLVLLGFPPIEISAYLLFTFALLALLTLRLPSILAARHALQVEADLPLALREFSLCLKIKMPFEKALGAVASSGYASSPLFAESARAIAGGTSVPSALALASSRVRSLPFARAMHQLSVVYEEGGDAEPLLSLADELADVQLSAVREFGAKVGFSGLLYIAASALLPAFFLIVSIGGGPLSDGGSTSPLSVWAFYLLAVPLANLAVLASLSLSSPPVFASHYSDAEDYEFDLLCEKYGIAFPLRKQFVLLAAAFLAAGAAAALLLSFTPAAILFGIAIASIPALLFGVLQLQVSSRTASIDSNLPSALMAASSQQRSFSLDKSLLLMSKASSGPLSSELESLSRQISAGSPIPQALSAASSRSPSVLWRRCLNLLLIGYRTGANMQKAIRQASDDALALFSLVRERSAALSLQRYTLIGASILVPLILAKVIGFISILARTFASIPDSPLFGQSGAASMSGLIGAAMPACQIYLVLYALITAAFLSMQEGRREKFFFYAVLLLLLSQGVWVIASI